MIALVRATANLGPAEPDERLWAFAAQLRQRHVRRAAEAVAVRAVLLTAVPCVAVAWLWPTQRLVAAALLLAVVATSAAWAGVRARRIADAVLLRGGDAAHPLDPVGDELATWLEHHRGRTGDASMLGWLGRDVDARLPGLPAKALADVGRRRLGRWRRLVPIVLVLVLAWLIAEWLAPPWSGLGGGGGGARDLPRPGAGGGAGEPGTGGGSEAPPPPAANEAPPDRKPEQPPPPTAPPPPPPAATEPPPVEPEAPAPLLELPEQQRFVVPEFVGDGPSRRVRMHAAERQQRGGAPRTATSSTGGGEGEAPAAPPPTAALFARAAEAAQRARHVPDEERPMVRRFFDLLREAAK